MTRAIFGLVMALAASPAVAAETPVVVELFTSQGCSSCPPADALLTAMARRDPGLLALDMHVTYWDRLGWKDPFSLPQATARQRAYGAALGLDTIYTPQMVVGGRFQAVGSDPDAVAVAVAQARAKAGGVAMSLRPISADPGRLIASAGRGEGAGTLVLVGFDPVHVTQVGAGENGGRTLQEVNVVRSLAPAGSWSGAPITLTLPRPSGERAAVLLQSDDGAILSAAALN